MSGASARTQGAILWSFGLKLAQVVGELTALFTWTAGPTIAEESILNLKTHVDTIENLAIFVL